MTEQRYSGGHFNRLWMPARRIWLGGGPDGGHGLRQGGALLPQLGGPQPRFSTRETEKSAPS